MSKELIGILIFFIGLIVSYIAIYKWNSLLIYIGGLMMGIGMGLLIK